MSAPRLIAVTGVLLLAFSGLVYAAPADSLSGIARAAQNSCLDCHRRSDQARVSAPTAHWLEDIHAVRGLGCVGCHGGDATDSDLSAMDPDKGFRGKPGRDEIAELCAKCHADAAYMKRFNPRPYVFSMAEFRTSVHCKKIAEGDKKVATCTNCHGVHGILTPKDPSSPVFHRNVPLTCSKCHNSEYMKGRTVPTNQFALYRNSVHGKALLERDDASAPACNDCHGNHGAVPPNTRDISIVCANCHGREGELFLASKVRLAFDRMGKRGCVTCHGNHDVQKPTDAMLSTGPGGTCVGCHEPGSAGERGAHAIVTGFAGLKASIGVADSLLKLAEFRGMETTQARTALRESQDRLVAVRAAIHSFDEHTVAAVVAEGNEFATQARTAGISALRDWRNRRIGMGLSLLVILATIGLLIARIRGIAPR